LTLHITREEERMLSGESGPATAKAMQLLVALGDVLGAEKLIPIESAQIAGVSFGNIGEAGRDLLEEWAANRAKVKVRSTLNPAGMDLSRWREMGISEDYHWNQMRVIKAFERMGVGITCTCTPYLIGNSPGRGAHVAWSESSAVGYANSVLGAMTNREGGPSALAAAVTGRTPCYGLHFKENRRATVSINVEARMETTFDFSLLGYTVGRMIGSGVPLFHDLARADSDRLKIMSAALAASGGIALFHVKGSTPEAARQGAGSLERICIGSRELEASRERLSSEGEPDLACIGCPHCSAGELSDLVKSLKGRRVAKGKGLWVWAAKGVRDGAAAKGAVAAIERAGGRVFSDTCMVVCPLEKSGFRHMISNSCKATHYVPSTAGLKATTAELHTCIEKVTEEAA
jgi:predicted aconitase